MKLYTYFRSSAAYRVRIALNLKGLAYDAVPVHLMRGGGEQLGAAYRSINPSALVPALQDEAMTLTQSIAILEYLEESHPTPPLLPSAPLARARVRELTQLIACDIHPLNNLRVLRYLVRELGATDSQKDSWYKHWVQEGFAAFEAQLARDPAPGRFCHGDSPTFADCALIAQVYNATRFGVDMAPYPRIAAIDAHCAGLAAFIAAHPAQQPDAE